MDDAASKSQVLYRSGTKTRLLPTYQTRANMKKLRRQPGTKREATINIELWVLARTGTMHVLR